MKKNDENSGDKKKGSRILAIIMLILVLLFLFVIFRCEEQRKEDQRFAEELRKQQFELAVERAQRIADSLLKAKADSIRVADSIAKEGQANPALTDDDAKRQPIDAKRALPLSKDLPLTQDTVAKTKTDTIPPSPSILPPPGRYYKPINLRVECGEPKCETELSVDGSNYNKTGTVRFRAIDSVGNASDWLEAAYDMASDNNCAANSFPVPVKGKTICVDAYEFPNKAGEKPRNMVSHDVASSLCKQAGKRLCSVEEWQAACKGNSNSRYPYGSSYNQTKCVTDLRSAKEPNRSGFAEHCRSYFGMYDMSGNLWEWTSTPAERDGLFLVAGGAWNTQNASSCNETKFSFYPQNEYAFVGFRCCSDIFP